MQDLGDHQRFLLGMKDVLISDQVNGCRKFRILITAPVKVLPKAGSINFNLECEIVVSLDSLCQAFLSRATKQLMRTPRGRQRSEETAAHDGPCYYLGNS